jgi:hypothetical protein
LYFEIIHMINEFAVASDGRLKKVQQT